MRLVINEPITYFVSSRGNISYKKRIKNIVKKIIFRKKSKKVFFIDQFFYNSHFSSDVVIKSYYGGGIVDIGENNLLMCTINIEGPLGRIKIANNTFIGGGTQLNSMSSISIGSHVLIAGNCTIQDHNSHSISYLERRGDVDLSISRFLGKPKIYKDFSKVKTKDVFIDDDVWIGQNSIILKGVRIGKQAIIGAGSVVTKDVPENAVVAGNPAAVIRINKSESK